MTVVRIDQAGVVHDTDTLALRHLAQQYPEIGPLLAHFLGLRPEWQQDAACAEHDRDLWFPERGGSTEDAKAICRECLVRDECLGWALEHGERHGIWGGLSTRERKRLTRTAASDIPGQEAA